MNEIHEQNPVFFNIDDLSKYPGLVRRDIHKARRPFAELVDFGVVSRPSAELYYFDLFNL
jgi:hypothetical protein